MSTDGKDLFSKQSELYKTFRPSYPPSLFDFIAKHTPGSSLAWDVGTGNGQAACSLAKHFSRVVATDLSANQITNAQPNERVTYKVNSAELPWKEVEELVGPAGSVDVVTVAQALHWFKLDDFYHVVKKALKPGGVFAAWCYTLPSINPEVDKVFATWYDLTGPFWDPARHFIDEEYRTIPIPFEPLPGLTETGPLVYRSNSKWKLQNLIGFIKTWSAVQTAKEQGRDLVGEYAGNFEAVWGDPEEEKEVFFPIYLRIGRQRSS